MLTAEWHIIDYVIKRDVEKARKKLLEMNDFGKLLSVEVHCIFFLPFRHDYPNCDDSDYESTSSGE